MADEQTVQSTIETYKTGLGQFCEKLPDVGAAYMDFTAACFRPGQLAEKQKHLIALGIAVSAGDETCILYHADAALATGASEQEILETIGVCAAFGGGAALSQGVTLVQDAVRAHSSRNRMQ